MKPLNDLIVDLRRDIPRNCRLPLVEGVYLFMHIDVYPVVTNQFDSCRRYYSTKPSLTIIEPIQRIAHRLPQLQIPRPRTEPLPTLDLSNNYFPRHSPCFANYLNPISSEMQYMNHDPTIKDPVPERKVVCVGLDQVSDSLLSSLSHHRE